LPVRLPTDLPGLGLTCPLPLLLRLFNFRRAREQTASSCPPQTVEFCWLPWSFKHGLHSQRRGALSHIGQRRVPPPSVIQLSSTSKSNLSDISGEKDKSMRSSLLSTVAAEDRSFSSTL
ncbi:hypothetical protein INR49_003704, partial [Caranx melampygus]